MAASTPRKNVSVELPGGTIDDNLIPPGVTRDGELAAETAARIAADALKANTADLGTAALLDADVPGGVPTLDANGHLVGPIIPRTVLFSDIETVPELNEQFAMVDSLTLPTVVEFRLGDGVTPGGVPAANAGSSSVTSNYVMVDAGGATPTAKATALRTALSLANARSPGGVAKSATNRVTVLIPPGVYDLGTTPLTLNTQFVDLVGTSGNAEHVVITSQVSTSSSGTVVQTANDVLIANVTIDNTQTENDAGVEDSTDPSAYAPSTNLPLAKLRNVILKANGAANLWRLRNAITYSGTYTDVVGMFSNYGAFSGNFIGCTLGEENSGGITYSGYFEGCKVSVYGGVVSGKMIRCTGLTETSVFLDLATISGTLIDCRGGDGSFSGPISGANARVLFCRSTGTFGYGARSGGAKVKRSFYGDTEINDA